MKYQRIIDALYHQPLAISRAGFDTINAIVRPILEGKRPDQDFFGGDMPKMEMEDGIAVIPVFGPLMQHASLLDKQCGATSYDDIREDLESAANARVSLAILNIDSPGGQLCGCLELADFISDFREETDIPVCAYSDSQMCSAAYFIAAGCDQIFCSRTAIVGSIGVILGWMDQSKANEMEGLSPVVFTSGKFKSVGDPSIPLTDEQSKYLQSLVDDGFQSFAGHVTAHRPHVEMDSMQGQIFHGAQAIALGLADDSEDNLDDVIQSYQDFTAS